MRVSKQVMAKNNLKIVNEAARLFKEKGIENTSVADVMGAAGLTHGGFYRHFRSKDELVCAAIKKSFNDIAISLENEMAHQNAKQVIADFVLKYLSEQHVANLGGGCPIAALGAEIDRNCKAQKDEISRGSEQLVTILMQGIDGETDVKQNKATALLALLVGTLVLARSAKNKQKMRQILSSASLVAEFCLSS